MSERASERARLRRGLRLGLLVLLFAAVALELLVGPVPITLGQALAIELGECSRFGGGWAASSSGGMSFPPRTIVTKQAKN